MNRKVELSHVAAYLQGAFGHLTEAGFDYEYLAGEMIEALDWEEVGKGEVKRVQ